MSGRMSGWATVAKSALVIGSTITALWISHSLFRWYSKQRNQKVPLNAVNRPFVVLSSPILNEQSHWNPFSVKIKDLGAQMERDLLNRIQQATSLPNVMAQMILEMLVQTCPGQAEEIWRPAIFCPAAQCSTRWITFSSEMERTLHRLLRHIGCDMMVLHPDDCRRYLDHVLIR